MVLLFKVVFINRKVLNKKGTVGMCYNHCNSFPFCHVTTVSRGDLSYFFLMAENYNYFAINEKTGVITIHQPLQNDTTYILYVFARDQTSTPKIST